MSAPLDALLDQPIDDTSKGFPCGRPASRLKDIGLQGWNLLRQDLPLPCAVLKESALDHNSQWMRRFLSATGTRLAPHGKTTMSPQLFHRQIEDGAWAITLASAQQVMVARRFGIRRILLANEILDPPGIAAIIEELRRDPDFDFYCLVDSIAGVERLADAALANPPGRPVQVLLEGGIAGMRAGVRDLDAALGVARAVAAARPRLALRGVEGFEGLIASPDHAEAEARVGAFLDFLVEIARACEKEALFAEGPVILSAGGSAYYDLVAERFADAGLGREVWPVVRAGCYLSHDSVSYRTAFARILERSRQARTQGDGLRPAIELWAHVLSRPEATRAILGFGKRDAGFDAGFPVPQVWFRPNDRHPKPVPEGHRVVALNDQHAHLELPAGSPLGVGDMVGLGISHPCLTFDRWTFMPIVDDDYRVVSAIRTFF